MVKMRKIVLSEVDGAVQLKIGGLTLSLAGHVAHRLGYAVMEQARLVSSAESDNPKRRRVEEFEANVIRHRRSTGERACAD